jgi:hypothetical protein
MWEIPFVETNNNKKQYIQNTDDSINCEMSQFGIHHQLFG